MGAWITFEKFSETFCWKIDERLSEKYQNGIRHNLMSFLLQQYPSSISWCNGQWEVDKRLYKEYEKYFDKRPQDFSVKDFVYSALKHMGVPPIDSMSAESLEKKMRDIFDSP